MSSSHAWFGAGAPDGGKAAGRKPSGYRRGLFRGFSRRRFAMAGIAAVCALTVPVAIDGPAYASSVTSPSFAPVALALAEQNGVRALTVTAQRAVAASTTFSSRALPSAVVTSTRTGATAVASTASTCGIGSLCSVLGGTAGAAITAGGVTASLWNVDPATIGDFPPGGATVTTGWTASTTIGTTIYRSSTIPVGSVYVSVVMNTAATYTTAAGALNYTVTVPSFGVATDPTNDTAGLYVRLYCRTISTGVVSMDLSGSNTVSRASTPGTSTSTRTCGAGKAIERLEFFSEHANPGPAPATVFHPEGSPVRPTVEGTVGQVTTTVTCRTAGGTTYTMSATGPSGVIGSDTLPAPSVLCPGGELAVGVQHELVIPGAGSKPLDSYTAPSGIQSTDPSCWDGVTQCVLDLRVVQPGAGTASCFATPSACLGWYTSPTRAQDFTCTYGPAAGPATTVPLNNCSIYRNIFDGGQIEEAIGSSTTSPGAGTSGDPDPESCGLGWGALLDGSIVYKAVSCALKWAFVPSPGTFEGAGGTITDSFAGSAPGQAWAAIGPVFEPLTTMESAVDCNGLDLHIPSIGIEHWHPFHSCTDPNKWLNEFWMPLATGLVYLNAAILIGSILLSSIGAGLPFLVGDPFGDARLQGAESWERRANLRDKWA